MASANSRISGIWRIYKPDSLPLLTDCEARIAASIVTPLYTLLTLLELSNIDHMEDIVGDLLEGNSVRDLRFEPSIRQRRYRLLDCQHATRFARWIGTDTRRGVA
jgi:hypothetical protein